MYKKIVSSLLLLIPVCCVKAQLRLPRLCSDGMVLQSRAEVPVWGWAGKGNTVKVNFRGQVYTTKAALTGRWQLRLPAAQPGGPYKMTISSGQEQLTIQDIWIGEVWVCSGQSNMEHDLTSVIERYPKLLAEGNYPRIRQFKVPGHYNFKQTEADYTQGSWLPATHEHIGAFTAVGFFFAQQLQEQTKEAVGIINISLGGSPIEAWLPESALKKYPKDNATLEQFKSDSLVTAVQQADRKKSATWQNELNQKDRGLAEGWCSLPAQSPEVAAWPSMSVPGYWADQGLGFLNGVVWLKKSVLLSDAGSPEKKAKLVLGRMVDADSVFVNGHYVGNTTYQYPRRRYVFPDSFLRRGDNTITIRLVSQSGKGGFVPDKIYGLVRGTDTTSLAGRWKLQVGAVMNKAPSQTFVQWAPAGLYNGMLAPAFTYGIKGFIWYQGESNADNADEYGAKLKDLLGVVRTGWKNSTLPFLVVQLPGFMQQSWDANAHSGWAALRQQQMEILDLPGTGIAVTTDLGEWNDVHPLDKRPVGKRLFLLAEDLCYAANSNSISGPAINPDRHSPIASKATLRGDTVYIDFRLHQSLQIKNGGTRLEHFAVAGTDGKYHWAKAGIKGSQVWVYSAGVTSPKRVRYGWSDNPLRANLENKAGLPASPFELQVSRH